MLIMCKIMLQVTVLEKELPFHINVLVVVRLNIMAPSAYQVLMKPQLKKDVLYHIPLLWNTNLIPSNNPITLAAVDVNHSLKQSLEIH